MTAKIKYVIIKQETQVTFFIICTIGINKCSNVGNSHLDHMVVCRTRCNHIVKYAHLELMLLTQQRWDNPTILACNSFPFDFYYNIENLQKRFSANSISKKLRPYIASHWRMEHGIPRLMPTCANNLVNWVKDMQQKSGIKNLYLATEIQADYFLSCSR
jgi:hypothetical protein